MRDKLENRFWKSCMVKMLIFAAFLFLAGCAGDTEGQVPEELAVSDDAPSEEESPEEEMVWVYVCGAVNTPGVYEMDAGTRVFEAVQAAGGMADDAAADSVNLARNVSDGEQIYIPTEEEASAGAAGSGPASAGAQQGKVNINTASLEELMTLTGIGEAKAESIIRYREENGGFRKPEDLMEISGIKEGVFEKIKDDIII